MPEKKEASAHFKEPNTVESVLDHCSYHSPTGKICDKPITSYNTERIKVNVGQFRQQN